MPEGGAEDWRVFLYVCPRWRMLRLAEPVVKMSLRDVVKGAILKADMQN